MTTYSGFGPRPYVHIGAGYASPSVQPIVYLPPRIAHCAGAFRMDAGALVYDASHNWFIDEGISLHVESALVVNPTNWPWRGHSRLRGLATFTASADFVPAANMHGSFALRADAVEHQQVQQVAAWIPAGYLFGWYWHPETGTYTQEWRKYPVTLATATIPRRNDLWADAKTFNVGFTEQTTLVDATTEPGEPDPWPPSGGQSLWYKFAPTTNGLYKVEVIGGLGGYIDYWGQEYATKLETVVAVYTGPAVDDLRQIAVAAEGTYENAYTNTILFNGVAGETYYFQVVLRTTSWQNNPNPFQISLLDLSGRALLAGAFSMAVDATVDVWAAYREDHVPLTVEGALLADAVISDLPRAILPVVISGAFAFSAEAYDPKLWGRARFSGAGRLISSAEPFPVARARFSAAGSMVAITQGKTPASARLPGAGALRVDAMSTRASAKFSFAGALAAKALSQPLLKSSQGLNYTAATGSGPHADIARSIPLNRDKGDLWLLEITVNAPNYVDLCFEDARGWQMAVITSNVFWTSAVAWKVTEFEDLEQGPVFSWSGGNEGGGPVRSYGFTCSLLKQHDWYGPVGAAAAYGASNSLVQMGPIQTTRDLSTIFTLVITNDDNDSYIAEAPPGFRLVYSVRRYWTPNESSVLVYEHSKLAAGEFTQDFSLAISGTKWLGYHIEILSPLADFDVPTAFAALFGESALVADTIYWAQPGTTLPAEGFLYADATFRRGVSDYALLAGGSALVADAWTNAAPRASLDGSGALTIDGSSVYVLHQAGAILEASGEFRASAIWPWYAEATLAASGTMTARAASGSDMDIVNFLARANLDQAHEDAYTTLLTGITNDGLKTKIDALYVFATQNQETARLNLLSTSYGLSGTKTFTQDRGISGASYLSDSAINAMAKFSQNSAHLSVWDLTSSGDSGRIGGANNYLHIHASYSGYPYYRINNASYGGNGAYAPSSAAFFVGVRTSATQIYGYRNSELSMNNSANTSIAPNVNPLTFPATTGSTDLIAAGSIGSALTDVDVYHLYSRLYDYLVAVGNTLPEKTIGEPFRGACRFSGTGALVVDATQVRGISDYARFSGAGSLSASAVHLRAARASLQGDGHMYSTIPVVWTEEAITISATATLGSRTVPADPVEIFGANLAGWYVADTGVYSDAGITPATNGQGVYQWNDQSGNGNHLLQATAGERPTFYTSGLNGRPAVRLAIGRYMLTNANSFALGGTTVGAFASAALNSAAANYGRLLDYLATGSPNDYNNVASCCFLYGKSIDLGPANSIGTSRNSHSIAATITYDVGYRFGCVYDGANQWLLVNNAPSAPYASVGTFGSLGRLGIGTLQPRGTANDFNGPVAQIVVVKCAPTQYQLDALDEYLRYHDGFEPHAAAASLAGDSSVIAVGGFIREIAATFSAQGTMAADASPHFVLLAGGSSLAVDAIHVCTASANIAASASLAASSTLITQVAADIQCEGSLAAYLSGPWSVEARISGSGSVIAAPINTPPDIFGSDLLAWYKADAGVYSDAGITPAADSEKVQQWNDQSGNGYHLSQADSVHRPTFYSYGFNSHPAVTFAVPLNTQESYLQTGASAVALGGNALAAFAAAQMATGTEDGARLADFLASGQAHDYDNVGSCSLIERRNTFNSIGGERNNSGIMSIQSIALDTNYRLGGAFNGSAYTSYVNNTAGTPYGNQGAFAANGMITLGVAAGDVNGGWVGPVAEMIIVKCGPSEGQRASLDEYLKWRFGL